MQFRPYVFAFLSIGFDAYVCLCGFSGICPE